MREMKMKISRTVNNLQGSYKMLVQKAGLRREELSRNSAPAFLNNKIF